MSRPPVASIHLIVVTIFLTVATASTSDREGESGEDFAVKSAAAQLATRLLDFSQSRNRPPLTSDEEHARSIDPVLTREAAVWIREELPAPPLIVMGGRFFSYRDVPYDHIEAPVLKIRPIDGGQNIPFVVRVVLDPDDALSPQAVLTVSLPTPNIFNPRVANVKTWVGARHATPSIDESAVSDEISIRVPLAAPEAEPDDRAVMPVTVIVEGELLLDTYRTLQPGRFRNVADIPYPPALEHLSGLQVGRDGGDQEELRQTREIAAAITPGATSDYKRVETVNSWVANSLRYRESLSTRSPLEALEDRSGDCDEHAALMVAMLRAMGIASRRATGLLYDLNTLSAHTWVEVALPTRDSSVQWFIVDPTLAGSTPIDTERASFVQFRDRILLYPIRPTISVKGVRGRRTTDVLINWQLDEPTTFTDGIQADHFVDQVVAGVDQALERQVRNVIAADLLLHRESSTVVGSPYLIVDRPLMAGSDSRFELRLENEERLLIEIGAAPGEALESKTDLETIDSLRRTYSDLNDVFFAGTPAHRNLELFFRRDRHTDRLQTVSLRFGRFLVENHLNRILKILSKNGFLTEEEVVTLTEIAEISGGKNLYIFQELARQHAR